MSKFNSTVTKTPVINQAGGKAYDLSPKMKFVTHILTSFVQDQFYRDENVIIGELTRMLHTLGDYEFAAKAAVYARTKFGMRSITHIIAAEIPHYIKEQTWTKRFINKVVHRPDDITEILSYHLTTKGRKAIPNSLKKGLALSFRKFDEYQLAKYKGNGKSLSLRQAAHLVHPVGEEGSPIYKLRAGTLKPADTWEVKVAESGKQANAPEAKKEAWGELIKSRKLGYFALLRNLRNIRDDAPEYLDEALKMLIDPKLIKSSMVMPFRYMSAYENTGDARITIALNKAIDIACANVPKFEGRVMIALDDSGSMHHIFHKAAIIAAILYKANPTADICHFGNNYKDITNLNPQDSFTTLSSMIKGNFRSGCTDFNDLVKGFKRPYDVIIVLSDMMGWVNGGAPKEVWNKYCQTHGKPFVFAYDLTGYGSSMFPESQVFSLGGFSDKTFDLMRKLMVDKDALVKEIEAIEL